MAYNNGFPMGYQPVNYQPQAPHNNGIIWVQGEAGAKSYLVAPNSSVTLWDSEAQVIYLKSADASGMPSIKVLDYKIREHNAPRAAQMDANKFATKDDVSLLKQEIKALKEQIAAANEVIDE